MRKRIAICCTKGCTWGRSVDADAMPDGVTTSALRAAEWSHFLERPGHETTVLNEHGNGDYPTLTEVEHRLGDAYHRGWFAGADFTKKRAQEAIGRL